MTHVGSSKQHPGKGHPMTFTALATATAATLAIAYGAGQFMSKSIATEITIDAPADAVWSVLADTAAYADWNPFVTSLSGDLVKGATLAVTIQLQGKSPMKLVPEVLAAEPGRELRWVGKLGLRGIFDGEHYFILEETADGATVFRHGETFSGPLAYPLFALIRKDTKAGFEAMNAALKARAEAGA